MRQQFSLSECNHTQQVWIWWCCFHHDTHQQLNPVQTPTNFSSQRKLSTHIWVWSHPCNLQILHGLVCSWGKRFMHFLTLTHGKTQQILGPYPQYWYFHCYRRRMLASSRPLENSKKTIWFIHQYWLCLWYSTWQSYPRSIQTSATNWISWTWKLHSTWNSGQIISHIWCATATNITKIDDTIKNFWAPTNQSKCSSSRLKLPRSFPSIHIWDLICHISSCAHWTIS